MMRWEIQEDEQFAKIYDEVQEDTSKSKKKESMGDGTTMQWNK